MSDLPDWALDKAREKLAEWAAQDHDRAYSSEVHEPTKPMPNWVPGESVKRLAALLVEVGADDLGSIWDRSAAAQKAAVLAEVRRVVEDERRSWSHLVPPNATICDEQAACDEILARLEKL